MKESDTSDFDRGVIEALAEMQGMKRDSGRFPDFAMLDELVNFLRPEFPGLQPSQVLESLRRLYRAGMVEHHRTVNGHLMLGARGIARINPKAETMS